MSEETKNKALLKSLAIGMLLAGPIALAGCATNYDDTSSATASQKASGEAEAGKAEGEAEGKSYDSSTTYASGEAEGEAEGKSYDSSTTYASGEAEGEAEAEAETVAPVNCPPGTTPQSNGTCLQG